MKLSPLALAASVVLSLGSFAITGVASAQTLSPVAPSATLTPGIRTPIQFAPAQTQGVIARYIVGPAGHVRGFQLDNGAVVMVHGRHGDALAQQAPVGQSVHVDGFVANGNAQTILRASVTGSNGAVLIAPHQHGAFGPGGEEQPQQPGAGRGAWRHDPAMRAQMRDRMMATMEALPARSASGTIQTVLSGPRGHAHGVILADGTSVFFTRGLMRAVNQHGLRAGESIRVAGRGGAYPQGASVLAEQVTFADGGSFNAPIGSAQPGMQPAM